MGVEPTSVLNVSVCMWQESWHTAGPLWPDCWQHSELESGR